MKRWWNNELEKLTVKLKQLRRTARSNCAVADHPAHQILKAAEDSFAEAMTKAKRNHWIKYLENMMEKDIWTANKYVSEPVSNGGNQGYPH